MKDVSVTIRIPNEIRKKLNKVCSDNKLKRSELIRSKIEEIIKEKEDVK